MVRNEQPRLVLASPVQNVVKVSAFKPILYEGFVYVIHVHVDILT